MNLKLRKSVIKRILYLFVLIPVSISASSLEIKKDTIIYEKIVEYTCVKEVLDKNKKEIRNLKIKYDNLNNAYSEIEAINNEYSQKISPLTTELSNTINHIISLPTNQTSLETINSVLKIASYLSTEDKINKLKKYQEEFQTIKDASLLLNNIYNKENNNTAIEKLEKLRFKGEREKERKEILNLLETYCKMNNKIKSLFIKVDKLTDQTEKANQLHKGIYYKYTKDHPFLESELEKKKDNPRYKSNIKLSDCN